MIPRLTQTFPLTKQRKLLHCLTIPLILVILLPTLVVLIVTMNPVLRTNYFFMVTMSPVLRMNYFIIVTLKRVLMMKLILIVTLRRRFMMTLILIRTLVWLRMNLSD